ncbi:hypothetical protein DL96DRAFT_1818541 [Flagelloscypha sp. PMI_526]|nr:hypothetical protein DL96DRAFT_1818541 [Flagelloscypha sp. PMI_526]
MSCIASDPDIVGIGVRISTYTQNILSFVPAIWALWDRKVEKFELESVEKQSTTILITAFAILLSAVVQAVTLGLTNFHATIILNLSWMNNTNTFIWFILLVQSQDTLNWNSVQHAISQAIHPFHRVDSTLQLEKQDEKVYQENEKQTGLRRFFAYPVLLVGSTHLTAMAALGIWLWVRPESFGKISSSCTLTSSLTMLGSNVPLSSPSLRAGSLFIYSLFLVPVLNLAFPAAAIYLSHMFFNRSMDSRDRSIVPSVIGLTLLALINLALIVNTELTLHRNRSLQDSGDLRWTFGQTLAMLLLLLPLYELIETFAQRREENRKGEHTFILRGAIEKEEIGNIESLIRQGANAHVFVTSGKAPFNSAVQLAASKGDLSLVRFLAEDAKIDLTVNGGTYGMTALQAAIYSKQFEIMRYLLQRNATFLWGNGLELPKSTIECLLNSSLECEWSLCLIRNIMADDCVRIVPQGVMDDACDSFFRMSKTEHKNAILPGLEGLVMLVAYNDSPLLDRREETIKLMKRYAQEGGCSHESSLCT